jgi:hypothetical protein
MKIMEHGKDFKLNNKLSVLLSMWAITLKRAFILCILYVQQSIICRSEILALVR